MTSGKITSRTAYDWLLDLSVGLQQLGVVSVLHNTPTGPRLSVLSPSRAHDRDVTCEVTNGKPEFWDHQKVRSLAMPSRRLMPFTELTAVAAHLARAVSADNLTPGPATPAPGRQT